VSDVALASFIDVSTVGADVASMHNIVHVVYTITIQGSRLIIAFVSLYECFVCTLAACVDGQ